MPNRSLEVRAEEKQATPAPVQPLGSQGHLDPAKKKQAINALLYAYMQILNSIHVGFLSTATSAKELNASESAMSRVNNQENNINFQEIDQNGCIHQQGDWVIGIDVNKMCFALVTPGGGAIDLKTSQVSSGYLLQIYQQLQNGGFGQKVEFISKKATLNDYNRIQTADQGIQKERDFFANKIIVLQQANQVEQTRLGSKNDFMSQFTQEGTNLATIMSTLASELAQMLRTP